MAPSPCAPVQASRSRAAICLLAGLTIAVAACGSSGSNQATVTTTTSARARTTTTPSTAAPSTTAPQATTTTTAPVTTYLPMFPFGSPTEAAEWQRSGGASRQPDRLDAGKTALAFANFLGYSGINRVVAVSTDAKGAHATVGYPTEGARLGTAAVVHLIRYGTGPARPWEVVGTDDTDFTLDTPRYGATVSSPFQVGGRITGVDESITAHVQQLHANGNFDEKCCIAAGGVRMPWSASLSFTQPTDPVLIVGAATGGHIQAVERFAVTAVKHT